MTKPSESAQPPKRKFTRERLRDIRENATIPTVARDGKPLIASSAQRVFWYLSQIENAGAAYTIHSAMQIDGSVDTSVLGDTFDLISAKHEELRTRFALLDGALHLNIDDPATPFAFDVQHVTDARAIQDIVSAAIAAPVDMAAGPLARATLMSVTPSSHVLAIYLHHGVADHASFAILWSEIASTYSAMCEGISPPEPAQTTSYADYAAWEQAQQADLLREKSYWQDMLTGAPTLSSPKPDRNRRATPDHAGAIIDVPLGPELTTRLQAFTQAAGVTPFSTGLAAWHLLLQEITGQSDVVTSVPVTQRDRPELSGTIGPFVNTVAVRLGQNDTRTINHYVQKIQQQFAEARDHHRMPIDEVIEVAQPMRSPSHNPLFQTMFAWNAGSDQPKLRFDTAKARFTTLDSIIAQLDLTLDVIQRNEHVTVQFEYATALYDPTTINRYAARFVTILDRMVTMQTGVFANVDDVRAAPLSVIADPRPPTNGALIHHLFEHWAKHQPDAAAIIDGALTLDYRTVDQRANHLAQRLVDAGVTQVSRVAICLPKSAAGFIAALAVLKVGAAYVPVDDNLPAKRLRYILVDSKADALIAHATENLEDLPLQIIDPSEYHAEMLPKPPALPRSTVPSDTAYVIYTSGSTGQPKGVAVSHRAIAQMAVNWGAVMQLDPMSVVLQMASFGFDVAVADFVRALCFGGRLVLCQKAEVIDAHALGHLITDHGANIADFTPAVIDMLMDNAPGTLRSFRTLLCGSDLWSLDSAQKLQQLCPAVCCILHAYGLTETAVDALVFDLADLTGREEALPLGQPVGAMTASIRDEALNTLPYGHTGEICLSGPCLAEGYFGAPELTADRFAPQPDGTVLFRTGDMGRISPDGQIMFMGRADTQIKIRGYRIDPGEVENQLRAAGAKAAHVSQHDQQLVAYVTGTKNVGDLRQTLAMVLPDYMVPSAILVLDQLPLTANGKIDTSALPAPVAQNVYLHPVGHVEQLLADLWHDMLGGDLIGRQDNFFQRGGHSMLAVRMAVEAGNRLGCTVEASTIFAHPMLHEFARMIDSDKPNRTALKRRARSVRLPASFGQEAMWFLAQDPHQNTAYNMPFGLRLSDDIDAISLHDALHAMVARHEALRTSFVTENGLPLLEIADVSTLPMRSVDTNDQDLPDIAEKEAITPFDLNKAPLIRTCWAHVCDAPDVLFITMHHIISDGWSIDIFARELAQLYADFSNDRTNSLGTLPLQFGDYVQWQRDDLDPDRIAAQLEFWADTLGSAPALLSLPTDHPRPPVQDFDGARVDLQIDADVVDNIQAFARENATTAFVVILAAWHYLMGRLSGETDIVTGVPSANRNPVETQAMIGYFVNTLAIRANHGDIATPRALIANLKDVMARAQAHHDVPFSKIVEHLNPDRTRSHAPIFQTMLAWETAVDTPVGQDAPFENYPISQHHAKYDLLLEMAGTSTSITGSLQFATSLFDTETAQDFCGYFAHILSQFMAQPDGALPAIGLADPTAIAQTQERWNLPFVPTSNHARILPRFARVAAKTPEIAAVSAGEQTLNYGVLDTLSDHLGHQLRTTGLLAEQPVAVWANRSPQAIIAVLAILKAGGAVVPLDPAHPAERLRYMLSDAAPLAVLSNDPDAAMRAGVPADVLWSIDHNTLRNLPALTRPFDEITPRQAAYILYTSGTTGRPKGVVQTHRMLDNLIDWQLAQPNAPERVLQFASMTFDVSFQEILSALCGGSTLVLITKKQATDIAGLADVIAHHDIQRAFLPVAVLQVLGRMNSVETATNGCEIITAGEALELSDTLRTGVPKLGGAALHNQYGPTETHVVSQYSLPVADAANWPDAPPIGRAIANTYLHILDAAQNRVPDGVTGELFIGGAGVAQGYLNQPDLTDARFLHDPFSPEHGARMFKSGDLVRRRKDGEIDYIGRADDQVKIRGYRVEPGEVETVLRQHPDINMVTVQPRRTPTGAQALVAYFTGSTTPQELRQFALLHVPDYLCPIQWVPLDNLPLSTSGKVDRQKLPEPEWQAQRTGGEPLIGPTQHALGDIWQHTLGVDAICADDNFFALGGHSLLAARILFDINTHFDTALRLSDLFAAPMLADMAALLDQSAPDTHQTPTTPMVTGDPAHRFDPFALSDIQQAYLVGREDQLDLGGVAAHSYNELCITAFDVPRFEAALNTVINRHDMLRAVFTADGKQQILADPGPYIIALHDLTHTDKTAQNIALADIRNRMSHQVLDARKWPLFAYEVTRLSADTVHLHMSLDALIVDAASTSLLMRELLAFYFNPDLILPPVGVTFRDYMIAEQTLRDDAPYQNAMTYWMSQFSDMPTGPDLPQVTPSDGSVTPQFVRREKTLSRDTWSAIKCHAARAQITPSGMLLAAFCLVLKRYAQNPRFCLSLPIFNRLPLHNDINAVIGDFTSVLLFQSQDKPAACFRDYAKTVQHALWRDMDHAQVSGIEIMRQLGRKHGTSPAGLPVVFNSTLTEMEQPSEIRQPHQRLKAHSVHTITQTPQVWIDHTIMEADGALIFNWDSIDALFPKGLMAEMFDDYTTLLDGLIEREGWTGALAAHFANNPVLPDVPALLPTLHRMVLDQAERTPERPAIVSSRRVLNYATLRTEAMTLAAKLQDAGCRKGMIVALLLPTGWEQTVGVLATLIAGGVYLPLDPDLPQERRDGILARTGAQHILVQEAGDTIDGLPDATVVLAITADAAPQTPNDVACSSDDLAYVIFTSGSTGQPKGVMIDHGGAANTILDINTRIGLRGSDRILAVSALNFDLSVYDIFGPLSVGGAIVVPDADKLRDPAHWGALMVAHDVTVWNAVPALLGLLVDATPPPQIWSKLRVAMMSGDWIPLDLPDKTRAVAPDIVLWGLGGATEASIWSIGHLIEKVSPDWNSIPYGKAITGQSFHVLDDTLNERPDWVSGDLYIGGRGLAMGYWDDEDRTKDAFVTHPRTGARLYKTGDLGRRQPDGNIIFLGRADTQVKVQGYRVELGEIEAALERHPMVAAAAVRVWGDAMQAKRLAAYVVTGSVTPDEGALRDHLAQILPAYEIPSTISFLPALPLSPNGKVDRKQLPEPAAPVRANITNAPLSPVEQSVLDIVCTTLEQTEIAVDANLLAMGASSLDIVRISNALAAEMDFRPPLAKFMRTPSVSALFNMLRDAPPPPDTPHKDEIAVIEDPAERTIFKAAEKGKRVVAPDATRVPLARSQTPSTLDPFEANRSTREFMNTPVTYAQFSDLLACLMQNPKADRPRFQYASAGGLYPVQTYLYVKSNGVEGLAAGCYYLDPEGSLIAVGRGTHLTSEAYDYFVNRPTFESAAFAVFFVMDRAAIEPLYGTSSRDMALIETGQMAQHLTNRAGELGLGLCGIGDLDTSQLRDLFDLGPHHMLTYSMLGGAPDTQQPRPAVEIEEFEI